MFGLFDCLGNRIGVYKTMRGAQIARSKRMWHLDALHKSSVSKKQIDSSAPVCEIRLVD